MGDNPEVPTGSSGWGERCSAAVRVRGATAWIGGLLEEDAGGLPVEYVAEATADGSSWEVVARAPMGGAAGTCTLRLDGLSRFILLRVCVRSVDGRPPARGREWITFTQPAVPPEDPPRPAPDAQGPAEDSPDGPADPGNQAA